MGAIVAGSVIGSDWNCPAFHLPLSHAQSSFFYGKGMAMRGGTLVHLFINHNNCLPTAIC